MNARRFRFLPMNNSKDNKEELSSEQTLKLGFLCPKTSSFYRVIDIITFCKSDSQNKLELLELLDSMGINSEMIAEL